ncbi:MAG TPA: VWA domain-containing protein [Polyangia bacterium]
MTLAGAPLGVLGPAFAALGSGLIALYILKLRRRRVVVPFADLWRKVLSDTESTALWRKLRRLVSLLLQLVALALILFALGDPRLATSRRGRSLAILVDTSASMQATDGKDGRTRLADAQEAARKLIRSLGSEDTAMVVAMSARPSPVSGWSGEDRALLAAVDGLSASDTPADLDRALGLAEDALHGRPRPTLVLIGDGAGYSLPRVPAGIDLRYVPVGRSGDNVAITAFAVRRYRANQTAYEVLVEVQSFRDHRSSLKLELLQDGEVVNVEPLTLGPGERVQRLYPNLAGEGTRLEARLVANQKGPLDLLPLDDRAYALLPHRKKLKVLLVSSGNLFLEGALLLDENITVDKLAPAAWDPARAARYDAVVLDGFTPPAPPAADALYLAPEGPSSPFPIRGTVDAPIVTDVAATHPLMRWVTLKDLNIARASRFQLGPGDVAIASALHDPIICARDRGGHKVVALGFDLKRSDLPMRVAFPVLVVNALDWFAGADTGLIASYPLGPPLRLTAAPGARALEVSGPDGAGDKTVVRAPVHDGRATFYADRAGYYRARSIGASGASVADFAVNLASAGESRIAPEPTLTVGGARIARPDPGRLGVRRVLWPYLIALALALALVEWWTYNRRVTV